MLPPLASRSFSPSFLVYFLSPVSSDAPSSSFVPRLFPSLCSFLPALPLSLAALPLPLTLSLFFSTSLADRRYLPLFLFLLSSDCYLYFLSSVSALCLFCPCLSLPFRPRIGWCVPIPPLLHCFEVIVKLKRERLVCLLQVGINGVESPSRLLDNCCRTVIPGTCGQKVANVVLFALYVFNCKNSEFW